MPAARALVSGVLVLATCAAAGAACLGAPQAGCRQPTVPERARLTVTDRTPDTGDALSWTWAKGEATPAAAFGDPRATDGYALCVYDESGTAPVLVFSATAPAGDACDGTPCWSARPDGGFKYRDRARTPDGTDRVLLVPGATGMARIVAAGKGPHLSDRPLGLPAPPLALPLRVQLQSDGGTCWEAVYRAATRNEPGRLRARGAPAPPITTTTTTIPGPASCAAVAPPPATCAGDGECPGGYGCVAGECRGAACSVRADCPLAGECVFEGAATEGVCVCWGCGAPSCPLGCRRTLFSSGCICHEVTDCPDTDDVCFMGLCS